MGVSKLVHESRLISQKNHSPKGYIWRNLMLLYCTSIYDRFDQGPSASARREPKWLDCDEDKFAYLHTSTSSCYSLCFLLLSSPATNSSGLPKAGNCVITTTTIGQAWFARSLGSLPHVLGKVCWSIVSTAQFNLRPRPNQPYPSWSTLTSVPCIFVITEAPIVNVHTISNFLLEDPRHNSTCYVRLQVQTSTDGVEALFPPACCKWPFPNSVTSGFPLTQPADHCDND